MNTDKHQIYNHWVNELNATSGEEFFPLFIQFLDLLIKENPTKIEVLQKQIDKDNSKRSLYRNKAVRELEDLLGKVETEAKRETIQSLPEIDRYRLIKNGTIRTTESLPEALYHSIRLTIENYWSEGKFRKLDNLMSVNNNLWFLDYDKVCKIYPSYNLFKEIEDASNREYRVTPWGAYRYLKFANAFFVGVAPEQAGDFVKPEIIGKLKRLILYLLIPEKSEDSETRYNQLLREVRTQKQPTPELEQRYEKVLDEIKSTGTPQNRRGLEKKWDVLQAIWTVYESMSRADSVLVPIAGLTIKGRLVEEIDGIIEGLKNHRCFEKWERKDRWYQLENINHDIFPKKFSETEELYKESASE